MVRSFFGLRFLLALSVLLVHLPFPREKAFGVLIDSLFNNAGFAVTFFFILSGFCTALGYSEKFDTFNKNVFLNYYKKRIVKIYPLYIFTSIWALTASLILLHSLKDIFHFSFAFLLSATLLQSWTIKYFSVMNGASWFISTIFFCYLCTPFLILFSKNFTWIKNISAIFICLFIYAILLFLANPLEANFKLALLYCSPYSRIFHYAIGLFLGNLFLQKKFFIKKSVFEIIACLLCGFAFLFNSVFKIDQTNQITNLIYIPVIAFCIFVFAHELGICTKILKTKAFQYFGKFSMEIYLIHYVVIFFGFGTLLSKIPFLERHLFFKNILLVFITLVISILWKKFYASARNTFLFSHNFVKMKIK